MEVLVSLTAPNTVAFGNYTAPCRGYGEVRRKPTHIQRVLKPLYALLFKEATNSNTAPVLFLGKGDITFPHELFEKALETPQNRRTHHERVWIAGLWRCIRQLYPAKHPTCNLRPQKSESTFTD